MSKIHFTNIIADNGIYEIYVDATGVHIRFILPDPPPELLSELKAVTVVLNQAAQIKDRAVAEKFQQFAESILNYRAGELKGILPPASTAV